MSVPLFRFVLACLLLLPGWTRAAEDSAELIKQGDVYDQKIQPAKALERYLAAEKLKPNDVPLMLRIARQYRHRAAEMDSDKEKIRLSLIGKDYAARSVILAPDNAGTHLSLAISNAKLLPLLGSREKLEASKIVKVEVDKSLALDPDQDLAWHVLGAWHERLAEIGPIKRAAAKVLYGEIPEGSREEAVKCFQRAIKLNPKRLSHYVEFGIVLAAMGRNAEAREMLRKGLSMPAVDEGDPESQRRARELLPKLE